LYKIIKIHKPIQQKPTDLPRVHGHWVLNEVWSVKVAKRVSYFLSNRLTRKWENRVCKTLFYLRSAVSKSQKYRWLFRIRIVVDLSCTQRCHPCMRRCRYSSPNAFVRKAALIDSSVCKMHAVWPYYTGNPLAAIVLFGVFTVLLFRVCACVAQGQRQVVKGSNFDSSSIPFALYPARFMGEDALWIRFPLDFIIYIPVEIRYRHE